MDGSIDCLWCRLLQQWLFIYLLSQMLYCQWKINCISSSFISFLSSLCSFISISSYLEFIISQPKLVILVICWVKVVLCSSILSKLSFIKSYLIQKFGVGVFCKLIHLAAYLKEVFQSKTLSESYFFILLEISPNLFVSGQSSFLSKDCFSMERHFFLLADQKHDAS